MMYRDDFVVTLRQTSNSKTLREYRNDKYLDDETSKFRCRNVYIPYGSEYVFFFKNMMSVQRRIEIAIDGTCEGTLVIGAGSKIFPLGVILERFINVAKRFKVVHPDHPDVADPGNIDNGKIEIKVWREKSFYLGKPYSPFKYELPAQWPSTYPNATWEFSCNSEGAAATIEGCYSNQTFQTTEWRGDEGTPLVFEYRIIGIDKEEEVSQKIEIDQNKKKILLRIKIDSEGIEETRMILARLGFKTKDNGFSLVGLFPGDISLLKQLKGIKEIEVLTENPIY